MVAPLKDLKVVELTSASSVAFAGRVLTELGASVASLEIAGEPTLRSMPPFAGEESALFLYLMDGKEIRRVPALDVSEVVDANILLHDRAVSPEWRTALDATPLPEAGRSVALCTPYGLTGPKSDWQATELTVFHSAGEGWVMPSGLPYEENPDGGPIRIAHYVGQYQAGLTSALGAIAGLRRSRRRRATEWIDVSTQEAQLSLNFMGIVRYVDGTLETRANRAFRYTGVLPCIDGHLEVLTIEQAQWERLRIGLGDPAWARDPKLQDPVQRGEFGKEINARLRAWSRARTVEQAVAELRAADVPCGPFVAPEDLVDTPQFRHRRSMRQDARGHDMPGAAWKLHPPVVDTEAVDRRAGQTAAVGERPLSGLRVVDFTSHAAGPYCGLMLALLGCEVLRIESNAHLDINRRVHPVYGRLTIPTFDHLAGHKHSVTLNLKSERGAELARQLVEQADIVIENFRPGVMERLGLAWEDLSRRNPALVMLSLSANGQTGPESRLPGYAPIFAAEGGLGFMTGYPGGAPGELRNNMDHMAGLMSATVVTALITAAEASREGCYADLSAREVAAMFVGESIIAGQHRPSARFGNDHELWYPHGVYPCAGDDSWIALAIRTEQEWRRLCVAMGNPAWCSDERLFDVEVRRRERATLDQHIAAWTRPQESRTLVEVLQSHGIAAERSMSAAEIVEDDHLAQRHGLVRLSHPKWGERLTVEGPWRFEGIPQLYVGWSEDMGSGNRQFLGEVLGHTDAELEAWSDEKAVY